MHMCISKTVSEQGPISIWVEASLIYSPDKPVEFNNVVAVDATVEEADPSMRRIPLDIHTEIDKVKADHTCFVLQCLITDILMVARFPR